MEPGLRGSIPAGAAGGGCGARASAHLDLVGAPAVPSAGEPWASPLASPAVVPSLEVPLVGLL